MERVPSSESVPAKPAPLFALLLREFRLGAGLTQEELASQSGVSVRAISDLERGAKTHPQQATVQLLADGLGLTAAQRTELEAAVPHRLRSSVRPSQALDLPVGGFLGSVPHGPLIARTGEVERLRALAEDVKGGEGRLLLLAGEPGVGKTRLAQEATLVCRANGMHIATGRCYEPLRTAAYYPFLEVLSRLIPAARIALGADPLARWPQLYPLIPEDSRLDANGGTPGGGDQVRLFWAVAGLLEALSAQLPLVIALDDLHWADQSSLNLLQHLARQLRSAPVLLLGTYRDQEVDQRHPLRRALRDLHREHLVEQITLDGLPQEGTAALMAATLGAPEVSARFVDLVQRHTQGNAFFIEEVVRALVERGDAYEADGVWDCRAGDALAIPRTVFEAVGERLSRLSGPVQVLLSEASVLGVTFGFDELSAMNDRSDDEIDEGLGEALRASVIRVGEHDRYAFYHALTQRVLYQELTPYRRKQLHLAAGNAIEQELDPSRDSRAAELAWHFLNGGSVEQALRYALLAGDQDEARFAHQEAERHFRSGLDLARQNRDEAHEAVALEKLGHVLTNIGRYDEARALLEQSVTLYRENGDAEGEVRVTVQLGSVYRATGTSDAWITRVEELLTRFDNGRLPSGIVELYIVLETLHCATGRYREGLEAAERAAQLAREAGDNAALARAETGRGTELLLLSRLDAGLAALEGAIVIPGAADDPYNLVRALDNASIGYRERGNLARARELSEQSMSLADRIQSPWDTALALSGLGACERLIGDWASARAYLDRGAEIIRDLPDAWWAVYVQRELGGLCIDEGDWERAAHLLDDALASAQRSQFLESIRVIQRLLAELDLLEGRPAPARRRLEPLLDRPGLEEMQVTEFLPVLAEACAACGDPVEAERVVESAIRRAIAANALLVLAQALVVRGRLLATRGERDAAERDLAEAVRLAHDRRCPYLEARALFNRGRISQSRDDLEQAQTIFSRLGARPFMEWTEQALAALSRN
jgi:predicted ATPase/DNA-binding XRE family transcriptional regulator